MSTNYTGSSSGATAARGAPVVTEPTDGDPLNAAGLQTALQKLADEIAALKAQVAYINAFNTNVATSNNDGLAATGAGTGNGFAGTAGSSNVGAGVLGNGASGTSSDGVKGYGGSASGRGMTGTGGAPDGVGVAGFGTGNGNGIEGHAGAGYGATGSSTGALAGVVGSNSGSAEGVLASTTGGTGVALRLAGNATSGDLAFILRSSDPSSPAEGQMWYRSDTHVMKLQINGSTKTFTVT